MNSLIPELTIQHAAAQRETWLAALAAAGDGPAADVTLDLSGTAEIDSAGVQLLLALRRSLREQGLALHITRPSAAVHEALSTLGLAGDLLPTA